MSRMIPPLFEESIASDGEKRLFRALEQLSDDYTIIHSLGIAVHRDKCFGEIDFVVICKEGILCLEVKGGRVCRREGAWCFIDRYGREHRKKEGPYEQVLGAMHSLRKYLSGQFGTRDPLSRCLYGCGVVFPDMPFTGRGPDIIREVTFDASRNPEEIEVYLHQVFAYWRDQLWNKHGFSGEPLSPADIDRAASYLRGDFGFVPSLGYAVTQTCNRLLSLTRQQADRLAVASENPRILLRGAAGTGKTLLSLEHARRCVLRGQRVLFLCFNRNLCLSLRMRAKDEVLADPERFRIETLHGYLVGFLKEHHALPPQEEITQSEYYQTIVPEAFLDLASDLASRPVYDVLVVDEGQDLLRLPYIMCMQEMVRGGLHDGCWHICYDPNQNLYNPEFEAGLELIKEHRPVLLQLDINCLNTRQIAIHNVLMTGIPPARRFLVSGEDVVQEDYVDAADQRAKVLRTVKTLLSQGISPGQICLLSRYRFENSCLQGENIFRSLCRFQNITGLEPELVLEDSLKFCTIHSFKGLEAPVILLLDVDGFERDEARLLNYTALSRATSLLYVFYKRDLEDEWKNMAEQSADLLDLARL